MRRASRLPASALALLVLAGCAQVRKVGRSEAGGEGDRQNSAEGRRDPGEERRPTTSDAPARDTGQPAQHGRPPLPATPSSLVTADAVRQIKEQLRNRGLLEKPSPGPELDGPTSDALRKFQQGEGIAATGFPDQETLRRLNIDASEAYRSAPEETNR